ncbi:MAG: ABC transporter substrate-binding protein, partial [Pseudomonadales bacterium]|nr:ABC transporter substrate-binding protein [Pseudomonadales bacterium]
KQVKRPVLNALVEAGSDYAILWANPIWFKARDDDLLASNPFLWDADVWVSTAVKPIVYSEPENLVGLKIGARHGYFYKDIDKLVNLKKITRINQSSDYQNLQQLQAGNIDAFVMSRSSLHYWYASNVDSNLLYIAQSPHDAFTRHVLVNQRNQPLLTVINPFIQQINQNKDWKSQLSQWGIDSLLNIYELELEEIIQLNIE